MLGLVYFLVFASYGPTASFRTIYFLRIGLSTSQVGLLMAVEPLVTLIAGPTWSAIADRLGIGSRLLTLILGLVTIPTLLTMLTTDFYLLLLLVVIQALMRGPITPLMDSAALRQVGNHGHRYGVVRSMGSLGYAPTAWLTGVLVQNGDIRWAFVAGAALSLLACVASTRLRSEPTALQRGIAQKGLGQLIRRKRWRRMMSVFFVAMVLQGVTFSFAPVYMETLGASESTVGLAQAFGSVSQVVVLTLVVPRLFSHWRSDRLLLLSLACYAVRVGLWAVAPSVTVVVLTHLLTGLTWGTVMLAGVEYAARNAPPGLETTSQALMTTLVFGLGRSTGNALAGLSYDRLGPRPTFGAFSALAMTAAVVFGAVIARIPAERTTPEPDEVPACSDPS